MENKVLDIDELALDPERGERFVEMRALARLFAATSVREAFSLPLIMGHDIETENMAPLKNGFRLAMPGSTGYGTSVGSVRE
jgi:hypothetical protein